MTRIPRVFALAFLFTSIIEIRVCFSFPPRAEHLTSPPFMADFTRADGRAAKPFVPVVLAFARPFVRLIP